MMRWIVRRLIYRALADDPEGGMKILSWSILIFVIFIAVLVVWVDHKYPKPVRHYHHATQEQSR
jgi:hypothetical protein